MPFFLCDYFTEFLLAKLELLIEQSPTFNIQTNRKNDYLLNFRMYSRDVYIYYFAMFYGEPVAHKEHSKKELLKAKPVLLF